MWLYYWVSKDIKKLRLAFENTIKTHLANILQCLDDRTPSIIFRFIYFSLWILQSQNWLQDQFQYLAYQEYLIFPLPGIYIYIVISYLLWTLGRVWKFFCKLNFQFWFVYSAIVRPRSSAENIGVKISLLPPTEPLFTVIVLP